MFIRTNLILQSLLLNYVPSKDVPQDKEVNKYEGSNNLIYDSPPFLRLGNEPEPIPDPNNAPLMARFIVHQANWTSISYISHQKGTEGQALGDKVAVSDGPTDKGTGIPYFYVTRLEAVVTDLLDNDNRCSLMMTLAQSDICKDRDWDPEDPRCAHIVLTGTFEQVDKASSEYPVAANAIFERHPSFKHLPVNHGFFVAKYNIKTISVQDKFGGPIEVSVEDYLKVKSQVDSACFYVTKHSTWKGKYRRVLSIGTTGITTFNNVSLETTNRWEYGEVVDIQPASNNKTEFTLLLRKDKKSDALKFSCDHRAALLSKALQHKHLFFDRSKESLRYPAYKHHWSNTKLPVLLEVTASALNQLDLATNVFLASYSYSDIQAFSDVKDYTDGFVIVCSEFSRMHMFSCDKMGEIKNKMLEMASGMGVAITVLKEPVTFQEFTSQRLGKFSGDEHITSVCEFNVVKKSPRHQEPMKRVLCLTETCLLERDPQTYNVCTIRPLSDITCMVRHPTDPQEFSIEYVTEDTRTYSTSDRDSLLATLLDSVRGSGNQDVHVQMGPTNRGRRWGPPNAFLDQEVESFHLKLLHQRLPSISLQEAVARFNCNVPYSGLIHSVTQDGLFTENKEKLITNALLALAAEDCDQTVFGPLELEGHFHALRRLFASKIGFAAFTSAPGLRESIGKQVLSALKRNNEGVTHSAIDMMCCLLHPMHQEYDIRQEQLNKNAVVSSKRFLEQLLDMWIYHINRGTGALVVAAMLDFLTFALCVPFCETTDGKDFDMLLDMVASRGRSLFRLFQHTSLAVIKGAGLIMRALIEEGDLSVSNKMQALALSEGAFPQHLLTALFTPATDSRLLAHRELSRHLIGLWVTDNSSSMELLRRIFPAGLVAFLDSKEKVPESVLAQERLVSRDNLKLAMSQAEIAKHGPQWQAVERQMKALERRVEAALVHWGAHIGLEPRNKEKEKKERPVVLRRRRERVKTAANWPWFYYQFRLDHAMPHLIWNHKTRDELRESLENQIQVLKRDRDLAGTALISWNHIEFEVPYLCLSGEVKIGEYYLRMLLEKDENNESPIERSYEFFNSLYHSFLLSAKPEMRCMCLQAMAIVYGRYHNDIGTFEDTKYIVAMLEKSTEKAERDRLLLFIEKLVLNRLNAKAVLDAHGVRVIVDLVTLGHLHIARATVPAQSNVLEAGPGSKVEIKQWHYHDGTEVKGPYTLPELKTFFESGKINARSRCWALGMESWRTMQAIPQLKWTFLAKGTPVLNESELAAKVINILSTICEFYPSRDADGSIVRPVPRVKGMLTDSANISHIVQLLLTFDPKLVEKVSSLMCLVMQDNPLISTIYLTGIFYFLLMYNGSNVLPIARFLKLTHMVQAVRNEDANASEIVQHSVLSPLLPEAMLHFLENHGPEKFAETFLGDFDTPEVIWNREMRLLLIQKLAVHVAEFTPLLQVNTRARYSYMAIPAIRYPQLEDELFCNMYYLRHLCDTAKFPDWPIKDPIRLLKDVLDTWKKEVEKKPPVMSVDDAYQCLGLPRGMSHDDTKVRKAYYHLAHKYHPDKNPDGEEKFEEVNEAYKFLCSRLCWSGDGPNPANIVLVLQTQSILFSRYSAVLEPYKYAGYPQLIRTIQLETADEQLFSKSAPLLAAASELAYHTVHCSALNAQELRREGGLEAMLDAFSRCVSTLSRASKPNDIAVQVCLHVVRCYAVAAKFQGCRDKMVELTQLVQDICHILYFKDLTRLCAAATECVASLAVDSILQMHLLQAGCLWHLLLFMLNYDFTLEEGGVERSEEANQQEICNKLAKMAVLACGRLGGYLSGDLTSPNNQLMKTNMETLLTPYLAKKLSNPEPEEFLKLLNSNCRNPYLLWDNGTRAELIEYLKSRKEDKLNAHGAEPTCTDFEFTAHQQELRVGDVYICIYNEQPAFPLEDPKGFVLDLLEFLRSNLNDVMNANASGDSITLKNTSLVLTALKNAIITNPGVEIQCIGYFKIIFSYMSVSHSVVLTKGALEVIFHSTKNQECVQYIASSEVLGRLLPLIHSLPSSLELILNTLYSLLTSTKLVKEALAKGIVIHLLWVFCCSNDSLIREKSAEVLAKIVQDKLGGPRARLALLRFLPPLIVDAMRESPATAIRLFDSSNENPELIWDSDSRDRVCRLVTSLSDEFLAMQVQNPAAEWIVPDEQTVEAVAGAGELVVGGVYVRLFITNPGWAVRRPKEFLNELMDKCLSLMSRENANVDHLELVSNAMVALLEAQPALANHVPSFGHLPSLLRQMTQLHSNAIPRCAILILHQLARNEACVTIMSQSDCIMPLKKAMQMRKDMLSVACDTLDRLFTGGSHQLIRQALEADLVPFLLSLLDGRLEVENAAMAKAQIVKALQTMTRNPLYGDRVSSILEKSSIWCEYRDQKHDLFISNTPSSGYLTGVPGVAGYLTQGTSTLITQAPPPVDRTDSGTRPPPTDLL